MCLIFSSSNYKFYVWEVRKIRNVLLNGNIDLDKISVIICTFFFSRLVFLLVLNKVPVHSYSVEEITVTTQLEYDEVMIKDVPNSVKAKPGNQDMHNTRIPGINHEVECEREKSQELGHISLFGNITRNYSKDTGKDQCLSTVL